jgi:hypothetical protein
MNSNFNCNYMAMSSLTYILGLTPERKSVKSSNKELEKKRYSTSLIN